MVAGLKYSWFNYYSDDLNYPDKTNKTWNIKRIFVNLGKNKTKKGKTKVA